MSNDDADYNENSEKVVPSVGSMVLVCLNFNDEEGNVAEEKQFFGEIVSITGEEVSLVNPDTGAKMSHPPHFGSYKIAAEDSYTLKDTGETVNPEFTTEWTLRQSSMT